MLKHFVSLDNIYNTIYTIISTPVINCRFYHCLLNFIYMIAPLTNFKELKILKKMEEHNLLLLKFSEAFIHDYSRNQREAERDRVCFRE